MSTEQTGRLRRLRCTHLTKVSHVHCGAPSAPTSSLIRPGTAGLNLRIASGRGALDVALCSEFAGANPDGEIILIGLERPLPFVCSPKKRVDLSEIERGVVAESLFFQNAAGGSTLHGTAAPAEGG